MTFETPYYWQLLWLVLLLAILLIVGYAATRRAIRQFAAAPMLKRLVPAVSPAKRQLKILLTIATLILLVISLTDPRWGSIWVKRQQRGIDVVFALDVSRSMLADDATPNRLARARQMIDDMLQAMGGDRVALVTYAGDSRLRVPLTSNFSDIRMALEEVGPHEISRGGSKLGDAIRTAEEAFVDDTKGHKAIVIITDGEDHESFPVKAAQKAYNDLGIRIYTLGLGDANQGSTIPIRLASGNTDVVRHHGEPVVTRMHEDILKQTALAGNGAYIPAGTRQVDTANFYRRYINQLETREFDTARVEHLIPRYQYFAGAALLLLLIDTVLRDYRKPSQRLT